MEKDYLFSKLHHIVTYILPAWKEYSKLTRAAQQTSLTERCGVASHPWRTAPVKGKKYEEGLFSTGGLRM